MEPAALYRLFLIVYGVAILVSLRMLSRQTGKYIGAALLFGLIGGLAVAGALALIWSTTFALLTGTAVTVILAYVAIKRSFTWQNIEVPLYETLTISGVIASEIDEAELFPEHLAHEQQHWHHVSGHWRTLSDGTRTWVRPHIRANPERADSDAEEPPLEYQEAVNETVQMPRGTEVQYKPVWHWFWQNSNAVVPEIDSHLAVETPRTRFSGLVTCPECGVYLTEDYLELHLERIHNVYEPLASRQSPSHSLPLILMHDVSPTLIVECSYCRQTFLLRDLPGHLSTQHEIRLASDDPYQALPHAHLVVFEREPDLQTYQKARNRDVLACHLCGETMEKRQLFAHIQQRHRP